MVDVVVTPSPSVTVTVNPAVTPATPATEVTVLEGQPGPRGEKGDPGVASASAPLYLNSTTKNLTINQAELQLSATQITGLPGITTFVFTQNSLSSIWDITHNLGYFPQVVAQDSAGTTIEGAVAYLSTNHLTISFSVAVSGTAYLS